MTRGCLPNVLLSYEDDRVLSILSLSRTDRPSHLETGDGKLKALADGVCLRAGRILFENNQPLSCE